MKLLYLSLLLLLFSFDGQAQIVEITAFDNFDIDSPNESMRNKQFYGKLNGYYRDNNIPHGYKEGFYKNGLKSGVWICCVESGVKREIYRRGVLVEGEITPNLKD